MAWTRSSNLKSVWYSNKTHFLTVEFHGGRAYNYTNVPEGVYMALKAAPSKGRYFHAYIRTSYTYQRIR